MKAHSILRNVYESCYALVDWLSKVIDEDSVILILDTDVSSYKTLLSRTIVGIPHGAKPVSPNFTLSQVSYQKDIVLRIIEKIKYSRSCKNVLTAGVEMVSNSPFTSRLAGKQAVECRLPESNFSFMNGDDWSTLLSRIGDTLMQYLLEITGLFVFLEPSLYLQVTGVPIYDLETSPVQDFQNQHPRQYRVKPSRLEHGGAISKEAASGAKKRPLPDSTLIDVKRSQKNPLVNPVLDVRKRKRLSLKKASAHPIPNRSVASDHMTDDQLLTTTLTQCQGSNQEAGLLGMSSCRRHVEHGELNNGKPTCEVIDYDIIDLSEIGSNPLGRMFRKAQHAISVVHARRKRKRTRKRKSVDTEHSTDWIKPLSYHETCIKKKTLLFARNLYEKIPTSHHLLNNSASDPGKTRCIFNKIFSDVLLIKPAILAQRHTLSQDTDEPASKRIRLGEGTVNATEGTASATGPVSERECLFSKLQAPLETLTKKFRSFRFRFILNDYCPIEMSRKPQPRIMLTASKLRSAVGDQKPVFVRTSSKKDIGQHRSTSAVNISLQVPRLLMNPNQQPLASPNVSTNVNQHPTTSTNINQETSGERNVYHQSSTSKNKPLTSISDVSHLPSLCNIMSTPQRGKKRDKRIREQQCSTFTNLPPVSMMDFGHQRSRTLKVMSKQQKGRKRNKRTSGELLKMFTPNHQVFLFIRRLLLNTVPKELFGKSNNWNIIWKNIKRLLVLGKYDKLSLGELMSGMKYTECTWVKDAHFPAYIRHILLSALIWWLFSDVICVVIKAFFYLTETTTYRNRIFCYRKSLWHSIRQKAQTDYYKKQLIKALSIAEVHQKLQSDHALGVAYLRFLPKQTTFRPIINLGCKTELPNKKVQAPINRQLMSLFHVFNYLKKKIPALIGSSVFGKDDIYRKWKQFVVHRKDINDDRKLYFVKLDIKNCYDSINQSKLYEIMSHLLTQMCGDELISQKFVTLLFAAGKVKTNFKCHVCSPDDLALSFTDFVRDFQQRTNLTNAIIVDQAVYESLPVQDLLAQLHKHIFNNILMIGNHYFHMISGISQGSVLSNLLCNLYYGHMEMEYQICLNKDDEISMRMVDDFLYVTPYKENAEKFLEAMIKGIPEYNCYTNPEKSLINFEHFRPGTNEKIPSMTTDDEFFPWCGLLLHMNTLCMAIDYSRYAHIAISDTMTFELSRKPGEAMKKKLLKLLQPVSQLLLLDQLINSEEMVVQNTYKLMLLTAYRFHAYAKRLPYKKRPHDNPRFFERMIDSLPVSLWHRVTFRFAQDSPTQIFILSKIQVQCLCLMAFTAKLSKHHSVYKQLLHDLKKRLCNYEKKLGKNQSDKLRRLTGEWIPKEFQDITD